MLPRPINITALQQAADEFVNVVDKCFGLFLDSIEGFQNNNKLLLDRQHESLKKFSETEVGIKTIEDLDKCTMFFGHGPPTDPSNVMYHKCTQLEYKERNAPNGMNSKLIGRYCIVLLYESWESEYRSRFAQAIGINKDEIKNDLFGELRCLRRAVIHHQGRGTKDCESLKILPPVKENEEVNVSAEDLYKITKAIKAYVDILIRMLTGKDPAYRTIWHVQ
jgi:hypothetical protein